MQIVEVSKKCGAEKSFENTTESFPELKMPGTLSSPGNETSTASHLSVESHVIGIEQFLEESLETMQFTYKVSIHGIGLLHRSIISWKTVKKWIQIRPAGQCGGHP